MMKERSEVYEYFQLYYECVKTQLIARMKALRCDNTRELAGFGEICKNNSGMDCSLSVKHHPEQHGVGERMIRTITERMHSFFIHFELPEKCRTQYGFVKQLRAHGFRHLAVLSCHSLTKLSNKPRWILMKEGTTIANIPASQYLDIDATTLKKIPTLVQEVQRDQEGVMEYRSGGAVVGESQSNTTSERLGHGHNSDTDSNCDDVEHKRATLVERVFRVKNLASVYSPVVRLESLRILLTLVAFWDYAVVQMDVTTAFLNGDIDAGVYMEQPEGYPDNMHERLDVKASLVSTAERLSRKKGYTLMNCDACVTVKVIGGYLAFLPIVVKDLILFAPNKMLMKQMKQVLNKRFERKDLGLIHFILGWETKQNRRDRTIFINQCKYNCNGCMAPSAVDFKLSKVMCPTTNKEKALMSGKPYRYVFNVFYAAYKPKFNLPYVRECSQFLENPGMLHWRATKRGLRYSTATMDWELRLGGAEWCERNWVTILKRLRMLTSQIDLMIESLLPVILLSCAEKKTVALHTTKAEYVTLSLLELEVIHLCQMLNEFKKISISSQKYLWITREHGSWLTIQNFIARQNKLIFDIILFENA
ncbi:LOW QUALITY PROTEIN: Integrase catalytic core protein [Phytophthora palmivora]|uniref:Integrase catalytic core protein n=1 Tax=Phytophthora palmivora TaxID=4796 RepID=A0A2P4XVL5_9STRA|nr:LOW QUALITY PROTEIN: Integrase catalytic core protein [Phytophthora palmivora]